MLTIARAVDRSMRRTPGNMESRVNIYKNRTFRKTIAPAPDRSMRRTPKNMKSRVNVYEIDEKWGIPIGKYAINRSKF